MEERSVLQFVMQMMGVGAPVSSTARRRLSVPLEARPSKQSPMLGPSPSPQSQASAQDLVMTSFYTETSTDSAELEGLHTPGPRHRPPLPILDADSGLPLFPPQPLSSPMWSPDTPDDCKPQGTVFNARALADPHWDTATPALPPAVAAVDLRVADGADDAEELLCDGRVLTQDNDLDLQEGRAVGLRFARVPLHRGARVRSARLLLVACSNDASQAEWALRGEAADDAPPFRNVRRNVTGRASTRQCVTWYPSPWAKGNTYSTGDVAPVVQEIVDRDGWRCGNALVLVIEATGERDCLSFDSYPEAAPVLRLEVDETGLDASQGAV